MDERKVRQAVGAIIYKDNEYLLIHKSKIMDGENGVKDIKGNWDFPKGGLKPSDVNLDDGLLRELKEETGSSDYKIISKYDEKICFSFPKGFKYDFQETTMFYVEYIGNTSELKPQDEEIDDIKFFNKSEIMKVLTLRETKEFLKKVTW